MSRTAVRPSRPLVVGVVALATLVGCGAGDATPAPGAPASDPSAAGADGSGGGGPTAPERVTFPSADGLSVTADLYRGARPDAPTVLLFHQSASSRGEFGAVGPKLAALGYHALAVDLRWGGASSVTGGVANETAAAHGTDSVMAAVDAGAGSPWPTIDASYPDMVAALAWLDGRGMDGPRWVLGSSFSAMLVFRLAAEERVDGILAYSPGEYDEGRPTLVRDWAAASVVPVLAVAAPGEERLVAPVADAVPDGGARFVVAAEGRHGASILDVGTDNWTELTAFLGHHTGGPPARTDSTVVARDGTPLAVDLYRAREAHAVVALFHQGGGSARGEYGFLVPWLLERGYDVVAADLQGGGDRFGWPNRTVAAAPEPEGWSYCQALGQVEAVAGAARELAAGRPVVLWGSSYSAALVVRAAAQDPSGVAAVLAFSPASGEPMEGCRPEDVADGVAVPLLVVRPDAEAALPTVAEQLGRFDRAGHETFVARPGAHGSSALNPAWAGDVSATRARVAAFLAERVR